MVYHLFNSTVINFSTGKILASLGIKKKSQKKTHKSEKLFIEYLRNYINIYINRNFLKINTIFKIFKLNKINNINNKLLKLLFRKFKIIILLNKFKLPNKPLKVKKIRSIKKRLKKLVIKNENF